MARGWPDIESYTVVSDICVRERMEELFEEHRPDYVFHAAAYKHVPMMEDESGGECPQQRGRYPGDRRLGGEIRHEEVRYGID